MRGWSASYPYCLWCVLCCLSVLGVSASDFSQDLATCVKQRELNFCLNQTLEQLRPLMTVGIPELRLPPIEPMNVDSITFSQGQPPVAVTATFTNVVVIGLSKFITNYIKADPNTQEFVISMTVPQMDVQGFYNINGEVFILPLVGSGSFNTTMLDVTSVGESNIIPVLTPEGNKIFQIDNTNIDFNIGDVKIHMDNLFNGENKLLADTVNKFLTEHGQDVLKEVKPEISRQMNTLVTRVVNDAFSQLPADSLIDNLHLRPAVGEGSSSVRGPTFTSSSFSKPGGFSSFSQPGGSATFANGGFSNGQPFDAQAPRFESQSGTIATFRPEERSGKQSSGILSILNSGRKLLHL